MFDPQTGAPVEEKEYKERLGEWLPNADDKKLLLEVIANEKNWIAPRVGVRDPFETIGQPRRSAINI
jgi:hypothetical protein